MVNWFLTKVLRPFNGERRIFPTNCAETTECVCVCVCVCAWVCVCVCVCARARSVTQSCPNLCDPLDGSPPGSSVCGIFQARTLEWAAISSSRGSSPPRDGTHVSCVSSIGRQILYPLSHQGSPRTTEYPHVKNSWSLTSHRTQKLIQKCIISLNVRIKSIKLLEN